MRPRFAPGKTLRLPDERVRLRPDGGRAARVGRLRADRRSAEARPAAAQHLLGARKAQEKVFSQLGRWRELQERDGPSVIIGVGGCVASQEGEGITERAPFVDLVFGPQTLHRLPDMIARAARRWYARSSTCSFPEIEKFDRLPEPQAARRDARSSRSWKAAASTARFCVVPYTRGEEVSRPLERGARRGARSSPRRACSEITLLGQNVNAYRGTTGRRRPRRPRGADLLRRRGARDRAHPLHDLASGRVPRQPDRGVIATCRSSRTSCTCRCRAARTACSR